MYKYRLLTRAWKQESTCKQPLFPLHTLPGFCLHSRTFWGCSPKFVSGEEVPKENHLYLPLCDNMILIFSSLFTHLLSVQWYKESLNWGAKAFSPTWIPGLNQAYTPPPLRSSPQFIQSWSNCCPLWIVRTIYSCHFESIYPFLPFIVHMCLKCVLSHKKLWASERFPLTYICFLEQAI